MWFHTWEKKTTYKNKSIYSFLYSQLTTKKKNSNSKSRRIIFIPLSQKWPVMSILYEVVMSLSYIFKFDIIKSRLQNMTGPFLWLYQIIVDISAISTSKLRMTIEEYTTINHFNIKKYPLRPRELRVFTQ